MHTHTNTHTQTHAHRHTHTQTHTHTYTRQANTQDFAVGDRVVCAVNFGSVPFGARGTVISVETAQLDVIFEQTFMAGYSLGGR
jgi:hypothetical protein